MDIAPQQGVSADGDSVLSSSAPLLGECLSRQTSYTGNMNSHSPSRAPLQHHVSSFKIPPHSGFLPLQPTEFWLGRRSTEISGLINHPPSIHNLDKWNALVQTKSWRSNPQLRSDTLIGEMCGQDWEKYRADDVQWKGHGKNVKEYYERMNRLIDCYIYVDRLLDSSLPQKLLSYYYRRNSIDGKPDETYQASSSTYGSVSPTHGVPPADIERSRRSSQRIKRRPSVLYRIADEESPLTGGREESTAEGRDQVVKFAIYLNLIANALLLTAKLIVTLMTSSLSVVASLVDGVMDMLSSVIIFITSRLVEHKNHLTYPVGRSRLEPIGVLVFSIIMITSFVQVLQEGVQRLFSGEKKVVQLGPWAIAIMFATVVIKGGCWLWCRMVRNSGVQALAADALTDVVLNTFSILFPLVGYFFHIWWIDPLGGILLSIFVIIQWSQISFEHIRNLTGAAASPEMISVLLYIVMRFAKAIKHITAIHAYHAGDKINVEVDIILDDRLSLKDAHDLGESLQYMLESLPVVERAFVHLDYDEFNPAGHLR